MKAIKTQTDSPYKNKTIFIGIDTHKKSWSVSIRFNNISLKTFSMDPDPEALLKHLKFNYPQANYRCVYEAGFGGFWIQEALSKFGIECLVVHVCDIPTTNKDKDRKTDSNDARKLALELERGSLESIYIPPKEQQVFRTLCRGYKQNVTDITRIKNRIKGIDHFYGINFPEHTSQWPAKFIKQLRELNTLHPVLKYSLDDGLDDLEYHRNKQKKILLRIKKYLEENLPELLNKIMSIPGVGFKSAFSLISEIWDMNRFKTFDKLKSYAGLIPSTHSSGENIKENRLTNRRNTFLRTTLIESAWIAIRNDKVLTDYYFKLLPRMKAQQAITRIARKLLSRIRAVWLGNEGVYVKGLY